MKKIMFNDKYGLTLMVLEEIKTQTRRIIPQDYLDLTYDEISEGYRYWRSEKMYNSHTLIWFINKERGTFSFEAPYHIGEEIAIAQSYESINDDIDWATTMIRKTQAGWKNKMFVKAEDMPHRIRIKDIRVERLQDISEEDCLKEGVRLSYFGWLKRKYILYNVEKLFLGPKEAFACLINLICGKSVWKRNPYVFVYDFELVR